MKVQTLLACMTREIAIISPIGPRNYQFHVNKRTHQTESLLYLLAGPHDTAEGLKLLAHAYTVLLCA